MFLASDLIERLIDFQGADAGGDLALRVARRALNDALDEFPSLHRWTYYYTTHRLNLVAPYDTGTVSYNTATRELTLTGGTWPSWAALGSVRIGDVHADVYTRDSNSVLTLDSVVTFGSTITDSGYTLYQDRYQLPADFLQAESQLLDASSPQRLQNIPVGDWFRLVRGTVWTGYPQYYCFTAGEDPNRLAVRLYPYSDQARTLDCVYSRRLRPVVYDGYTAAADGLQPNQRPPGEGTSVSVTASSATVTGTGTAFRSDMIGSYIRLSRDLTRPTGKGGNNPYLFESRITAVGSATSLTMADQATESLSGVAWLIADPIDVETGTMQNAFAWRAQMHAANNLRMRMSGEQLGGITSIAERYLKEAKAADSRSFAPERALERHTGVGAKRFAVPVDNDY